MQGTNFGMPFEIVGKPVTDRSQRPGAGFNMVTPGYFPTFGIRITSGRAFTEADAAGGMPVAIVNSALVKKYFPDVDPLTQQISSSSSSFPALPISARRSTGRSSEYTKTYAMAGRSATISRRSTFRLRRARGPAYRWPSGPPPIPTTCRKASPQLFAPSIRTFRWPT